MKLTKQQQLLKLELWAEITNLLIHNTTLHYEACSKLAGEKADEIITEVRLMNLPDNPDIETISPPY